MYKRKVLIALTEVVVGLFYIYMSYQGNSFLNFFL